MKVHQICMQQKKAEKSLLLLRAHYQGRASSKVDVNRKSCVWKMCWYMNESMLALQLENYPLKP